MQGIVAGREEHPEEALQAAGVFFAYGSAVVWVTPAQLAELTAELEAMEASLAIELTGYYIQVGTRAVGTGVVFRDCSCRDPPHPRHPESPTQTVCFPDAIVWHARPHLPIQGRRSVV